MGNSPTPLRQNSSIQKETGIDQLYIKDESAHPHGTWKDRRSQAIIEKVRDEWAETLAIITAGNAGYSLGHYAQDTTKNVVAIVDNHLSDTITQRLRQVCAQVLKIDLSKKILNSADIIELVQNGNTRRRILDVTNGFHEAYETIIVELAMQLPKPPDYIFCPVGSGEAFVGIHQGIQKRRWGTKLVGVKPKHSQSFADKLHTPWTPYQIDLDKLQKEGHRIIELNEAEIMTSYSAMKNIIQTEPSGAVVYWAMKKTDIPKDSLVVAINSGRGIL